MPRSSQVFLEDLQQDGVLLAAAAALAGEAPRAARRRRPRRRCRCGRSRWSSAPAGFPAAGPSARCRRIWCSIFIEVSETWLVRLRLSLNSPPIASATCLRRSLDVEPAAGHAHAVGRLADRLIDHLGDAACGSCRDPAPRRSCPCTARRPCRTGTCDGGGVERAVDRAAERLRLPRHVQRLGVLAQALGDDAVLGQRREGVVRRVAVSVSFDRLAGRPNDSFEAVAHVREVSSVLRERAWFQVRRSGPPASTSAAVRNDTPRQSTRRRVPLQYRE